MNTETTPAPKDDERAKFEAWCRDQNMVPELWMPNQPQCGYRNLRIMDYWLGWQALAASGAPQEAPGDAPDIQFRLRTARRFAELQGEQVLSEQQCARHMGIDLVSWRKLVACFSAGTSFIEHDYPEALPEEDSETVLRAAMKGPQ